MDWLINVAAVSLFTVETVSTFPRWIRMSLPYWERHVGPTLVRQDGAVGLACRTSQFLTVVRTQLVKREMSPQWGCSAGSFLSPSFLWDQGCGILDLIPANLATSYLRRPPPPSSIEFINGSRQSGRRRSRPVSSPHASAAPPLLLPFWFYSCRPRPPVNQKQNPLYRFPLAQVRGESLRRDRALRIDKAFWETY